MRNVLLVGVGLILIGCDDARIADGDGAAPVRGLITTVVEASERTTRRRYPGVLEPTDITSLSFEVAGKLGAVELSVGQRISKGEVLARLDSQQFEIEIENRLAAVEEAVATLDQNEEDLERAQTLLDRGAGTRLSRDQADTDVKTSRAQLRQAEEALEAAREDLADAVLVSPFDGVVNSVDADSFATVSTGEAITSIYEADDYEVSFSVNFDTVAGLVVGTPATIRLADDPAIVLDAVVSELGERADTVSSFPVVVALREAHPILKAGMAVEVALEFNLPGERGFLIPMSAAITEGEIPDGSGPAQVSSLPVYVFDADTSTVKRRVVKMAGIRDNRLLIIEGLKIGERIAIAGVSFLHDGMPVKLIDDAS